MIRKILEVGLVMTSILVGLNLFMFLLIGQHHGYDFDNAVLGDSWAIDVAGGVVGVWFPFVIWRWTQRNFYFWGNKETKLHFDEVFEMDYPCKGLHICQTHDGRIYVVTEKTHHKWLIRKEMGWKGW